MPACAAYKLGTNLGAQIFKGKFQLKFESRTGLTSKAPTASKPNGPILCPIRFAESLRCLCATRMRAAGLVIRGEKRKVGRSTTRIDKMESGQSGSENPPPPVHHLANQRWAAPA